MKNKLKPTIVLLFLAASLSLVNQASSVTTFNFTAPVVFGIGTGEVGSGSVSYDETLLDGDGFGIFYPNNGLIDVTLNLFGQTFTMSDELDFDFFPELLVDFGEPVYLDFVISEIDDPFFNLTEIDKPGVGVIETFLIEMDPVTDEYVIPVTTFAVPDQTATLALSLVGLTGLLALRRRLSGNAAS